MAQNINQFGQTPEQGDLDLTYGGEVITCQVASTQVVNLVAGQAVKLADVAGGVPKVVALSGNTDVTFGFVVRNIKDVDFAAQDYLEIAIQGSVQYMTAGAAIARGATVEAVTSTNKVITAAGTNPIIGFALGKATADGELFRVYVLTPGYTSTGTIAAVSGLQTALNQRVQTARVTATLAELNAGKVLIAGTATKQIRVVDYTARVVGAFTTTTSADLQSETTGTKVTALGVAGLTNGAVLQPASANTTIGAGFAADLEVGEGLKVVNTGSAAAGGTSITFTVSYAII